MLKCFYCEGDFSPTNGKQKFCSKPCYRKYGKKVLGHSDGRPDRASRVYVRVPEEDRKKRVYLKQPHYRDFKLDYCEMCGFSAKHPCQLDVDHIDGNHFNDDPSNLQTLCANCHRYKTGVQRGWILE